MGGHARQHCDRKVQDSIGDMEANWGFMTYRSIERIREWQ
jgi:hypothetical protein